MKSIAERFKDGDEENDRINNLGRQLAPALVYESESGRNDMTVAELLDAIDNNRTARRKYDEGSTQSVAQEASEYYDANREELEAPEDRDDPTQSRQMYEPSVAGAFANLVREINKNAEIDLCRKEFNGQFSSEQLIESVLHYMESRK